MGEPPPPTPPSGPCGDCCETLPDTLEGRIETTSGATEVYTGTIIKDFADPCRFSGYLFGEHGGYVLMDVAFCGAPIDNLELGCQQQAWCVGRQISIPHMACFPIGTGVSADGLIIYSIS
jgi:hypothetical protein